MPNSRPPRTTQQDATRKAPTQPKAPQKRIKATEAHSFEEMNQLGRGPGSAAFWKSVSREDKLRYCQELAERKGIEGRANLTQVVPGAILAFLRSDEKNWRDAGFEKRMPGKKSTKKGVPDDPFAEDDILDPDDEHYDGGEEKGGGFRDSHSRPPPGYPGSRDSYPPDEYEGYEEHEEEVEVSRVYLRKPAPEEEALASPESPEERLNLLKFRLVTWKHSTKEQREFLVERFFASLYDLATLHILLSRFGVPANLKDGEGRTLLMKAIEKGKDQAALQLLEFKHDLETRDPFGETAMIYAGAHGAASLIGPLREKGANLNAKNNNNETALMLAAYGGHEEAVNALLALGANPRLKSIYGKTAADYAEIEGYNGLAERLRQS